MNKTPRLSKSGIEYLDYVWNFYSGCLNGCPYCWARKITERFEDHYPNGFEPTIHTEAFFSPLHLKKPSIIGCAFMGDLFGDWIDPNKKVEAILPSGAASVGMSLKGWIYTTIEQCPQHKFLFLTKQPQNLVKFSPFPENCWVGVTATNTDMLFDALNCLDDIQCKVRYVSIEPMLGDCHLVDLAAHLGSTLDWLIIGALTGTKWELLELCQKWNVEGNNERTKSLKLIPYGNKWTLQPKIEWVQEILIACHNANIPVFMKDNLQPLLDKSVGWEGWKLRQEMPL